MAPASLPAVGSVSAHAPRNWPLASWNNAVDRWASEPNMRTWATASPLCAATDSAIEGSTRANSSMQMQYSTADIPAPPNWGGT